MDKSLGPRESGTTTAWALEVIDCFWMMTRFRLSKVLSFCLGHLRQWARTSESWILPR